VTAPRAFHPYAYAGNDPLNNADPDGMTFWSVVGAVVGLAAGIALVTLAVLVPPLGAAVVAATVALMTVSYIAASATAGTDFGSFMRGFSIGLNAGLNAMLGSMVFGPVVGIALGVINFLAAFDGISGDRGGTYQAVLGWSSWLMPMSWLATGIGLALFLFDLVAAGVTGNRQGTAPRINGIFIDWGTGTIVTHGGLATPYAGGYNLGNFAYINAGSPTSVRGGVIQHEMGHTLQVAAFGSIWHFVGAWDENIGPNGGRGTNAYAEHLAESHNPAWVPGRPSVPWWALMWR
jgi:hypothetical protein